MTPDFDMEVPLEPQSVLRRSAHDHNPHTVFNGKVRIVDHGQPVEFMLGFDGKDFWLHREGGGYWCVSIEELMQQAVMSILLVEGM